MFTPSIPRGSGIVFTRRVVGSPQANPELPKVTLETLEKKRSFLPELKLSEEKGSFRATIATLNVKDKDGDVTLPGFFGEQKNIPVLIGHDWGMVPIGKGTISEEKDLAVLDAKLNLEDPQARAAYEWLKFDFENGEPAQEFSYGFHLRGDGWKPGEFQGDDVRFLQPTEDGKPGAKVHEASLVLGGAGEGTGTQTIKESGKLKFAEHLERTLAALSEFSERAKSLADLRAKEDRTLSDANLEKIGELRDGLAAILEGAIAPEPELDLPSEEQFELLMAQTEARIHGRI